MKVINYVCCVLVLTCFMNVGRSENPQDQVNYLQAGDRFYNRLINRQAGRQSLDAADETLKMKRPFCNAFTGCGRKRNFEENPDTKDLETGNIRLPISVYKSLLKAVYSQNVRNAIDRERSEHRLSETPQVYLSGRTPLHKRFDVRSPYP